MSDYTTPAVSDATVSNLAKVISSFYTEISGDVGNINEMLAEVITKHYSVNHEPQIELPFEKEYEYIKEKVNKSLAGSKKLDNFTHIFISGYLPNGKTIHPNSIEEDENGITVSKYAQLYINGVPYTSSDYTCRAEEGGWEKLNVLIIGTPKMSPYAARLDIDYADIPLKNFKMIVFDDLEEPVSPDINSFLAEDINTLKIVGNLDWTYMGLCTLIRLEVTKDIIVTSTMDCPCLQELIVPNVTTVPNTNPDDKHNIVLLDISNAGTVANINGVNLKGKKLKLYCSVVASNAFASAEIAEVNIGDRCQSLGAYTFSGSKVKRFIGGKALTGIGAVAFEASSLLTEVILNNTQPLKITGNAVFNRCANLMTIKFSYLSEMSGSAFVGCTALTNLSFVGKSISCNLYFNASPVITEESCLNIINAIADGAKITVQLHSTVKTQMTNTWYCKLSDGKYVSCTAEDEGAVTQAAAILARGGTLS